MAAEPVDQYGRRIVTFSSVFGVAVSAALIVALVISAGIFFFSTGYGAGDIGDAAMTAVCNAPIFLAVAWPVAHVLRQKFGTRRFEILQIVGVLFGGLFGCIFVPILIVGLLAAVGPMAGG